MSQYTSKTRGESLAYIQSMLCQLRSIAQAERCHMLAYLIEMAYVDASDIIRGERPFGSDRPAGRSDA